MNDQRPQAIAPPLFKCPFPLCDTSYTRRSTLRAHLTGRYVTPDEHHPAGDPLWDDETTRGCMQVYTRGGLSETERRERQKQSVQRSWRKHGETYQRNAKERRERIREILTIAGKLKEARSSQQNWQVRALLSTDGQRPVLTSLYTDNHAMSAWLPGTDEDITHNTFPRFVTYFLHPDKWPRPYDLLQNSGDDEMTLTVTVKDVLPGFPQYSRLCKIVHPDKNIGSATPTVDPALFDVLKKAWAVWEPVMRNTDVLETVMFTDMDASCTAFSETSDLHALAAELYWVWSTSSTKASAMLVPPKACMWDVDCSFEKLKAVDEEMAREEEEGKLYESDEDPTALLTKLQAMEIPLRPRKRKARITQEEDADTDDEEDEEEEKDQEEEDIYGEDLNAGINPALRRAPVPGRQYALRSR